MSSSTLSMPSVGTPPLNSIPAARTPSPLPFAPASSSSSSASPAAPAVSHQPFILSSLITKRLAQLDYLQRVHAGSTLWSAQLSPSQPSQPHPCPDLTLSIFTLLLHRLNTVRVSADSVTASLSPAALRLRLHRLLLLGLSLGRLVSIPDPSSLLSALSGVLDEWHYYASHYHSSDAHYLHHEKDHTRHVHSTLHAPLLQPSPAAAAAAAAASSSSSAATALPSPFSSSSPVKAGRWTVFTWLVVPASSPASFSNLSLLSMSCSMLALLSHLYTALLSLPPSSATLTLLFSVDRRVQSAVLVPLVSDLSHAASVIVKHDLGLLKTAAPTSAASAASASSLQNSGAADGVKEENSGAVVGEAAAGSLDLSGISAITDAWSATGSTADFSTSG